MIVQVLYLIVGFFVFIYLLNRRELNEDLAIEINDALYWNEIEISEEKEYYFYRFLRVFIATTCALLWLPVLVVSLAFFVMYTVRDFLEDYFDDNTRGGW